MKKGYIYLTITFIASFFFGFGYGNNIETTEKEEVFTETVIKYEENNKLNIIDNIEVEINTKLPTLDKYINANLEGNIKYYKNNKEINKKDVIKNVGTYKVVININNELYESKLIVKDTIKPKLELKEVTIYEGNNYNINSFIKKCSDNSNNKCIINYKNNNMSKYNKVGTYDIVIIAKDKNNNSTELKTKLNIIKKAITSNKAKTTNKVTKTTTKNNNINKSTIQFKEQAKKIISKNSYDTNEIIKYTNQYRKEKGVKALTIDNELCLAANIRAMEMAYNNYFEHTRPDGKPFWTVLNDLNINRYSSGENIAYGYEDAKEVSEAWKASKGHYANMINSHYNKIGIGEYTLDGVTYHVQIFANR